MSSPLPPAQRQRRVRRNWIKGLGAALSGRRCPVCGGRPLPLAASWMHSYLRCSRCDLIFVARLPRHEDLVAAYHRVHRSDYQICHKRDWGPWMRHKQLTLDALGLRDWEHLPHRRALDLGCGEGALLEVLQGRGWQARGLELNPTLAAEARRRGFSVVEGAVEHHAPPHPVELVTMNHLLEHLRSPLQVLERVRGWLAPPALLVLETPLSPDLNNIDHLYCFSAAALAQLLQRCGFTPLGWFDYLDDNYRHHNLACLARAA